jgi:hypothetical protein
MSRNGNVLTTTDPLDTDVLCGRGRAIRIHPGNRVYLQLITKHRTEYINAVKGWKLDVVKLVVQAIRDRNGRFLQREGAGWTDIGDLKAITKTSQAFRDMRVGGSNINIDIDINMEDQEVSSENSPCSLTGEGEEVKVNKGKGKKKKKKPFQIGSWTRPVPVSKDSLRLRQRPSCENSSSSSSSEDEVSETETEDSFPVFKGQQAQTQASGSAEVDSSSNKDHEVEEIKESLEDGSEQEGDGAYANDVEDDT